MAAVGYHINSDDGLISIRVQGSPAARELLDAAHGILSDDDYSAWLPQLLDLREWEPEPAGSSGMNEVSRYLLTDYCPHVHASIAVLISDQLDRELCADMYRLSSATGKSELFEDYDQAMRWLIKREFANRPVPQAQV